MTRSHRRFGITIALVAALLPAAAAAVAGSARSASITLPSPRTQKRRYDSRRLSRRSPESHADHPASSSAPASPAPTF